MSDDNNGFELTRRRILAGVGTVGAASAATGAGTMALFSDTETSNNNTVQAGTLDLSLGSATKFTLPTDGIEPGQARSASVDLQNAGSLVGNHVELKFSIGENDRDSTPTNYEFQTDESAMEFASRLDVTKLKYGGTPLDSTVETVAELGGRVFDGLTAPNGSNQTFEIDVKLQNEADNTFQADGIDLNCEFGLAQQNGQQVLDHGLPGVDVGGSSLLAYYPLDSVGDGTADNTAGPGLDGTVQSGISSVSGKIGSAAEFTGTSNGIKVTDDSQLDVTDPYSETAWVKLDSTSGKQNITMKSSGQWAFGFQVHNGRLRGGFEDEQDNNYIGIVGSGGQVSTGTWTHLAVVYDGTSVEGYVDGSSVFKILKATDNSNIPVRDASPSTNNQPLTIGKGEGTFDGRIDDLRIYDRPLSGGEVSQIADSP